jgi:serine protease Do
MHRLIQLPRVLAVFWTIAFCAAPVLHAQSSAEQRTERRAHDDDFGLDRLFVPRWRLTDGPQVRSAFRDVVKDAAHSTVVLECAGKQLALGGVVGADGWILTKATPLCGKVTCQLQDGRELPAAIIGVNREYDLALLKVDATALPVLDLSTVAPPAVGAWVATVGKERDPVAVGVVSVGQRLIPAQSGILGVQLDDGGEPVVERVFFDSPAAAAGVKLQDRITKVDGKSVSTRDELIATVHAYNPGDRVSLTIEREGRTMTLEAELTGRFPGFPMGRSEFQNTLGGELSVRRFGFPKAIQHDTVLRPVDCGGPVVDLDGRVVGFNIARAGRTESYAIPTAAVRGVIDQLMAAHVASVKAGSAAGSGATSPVAAQK